MIIMTVKLFYILAIFILFQCFLAKEFLHQRPDQHKSYPGWQEPGLWRPKWVMIRNFDATETTPAYTDKLYMKLKPDRTISIQNSRKRPWLQILNKGLSSKVEPTKKSLFESSIEKAAAAKPSILEEVDEGSMFNTQGTWSFTDETPIPTGSVVIETKEQTKEGTAIRIRHECRCDWGKLDEYAMKFRRGRIFKYRGAQKGSDIPLGKYKAGTFILKANAQRPLVSKDFQAFQ